MAKMGKFDPQALKDFQQKLEKLGQDEVDAFLEDCTKELAARLLRMVIKRTPVGQYPKESGKKGGTLRRGWTGNQRQAAGSYVDNLTIRHEGNNYIIEIVNPVEYASYVEYGHRTRDHKGWVDGRFMMTISENDLKTIAPKVLENKLKKFLGGVL